MVSLGFNKSNKESYNMLAELDSDGSGSLDFNEFFKLMAEKVSDDFSRSQSRKIFAIYDPEKQGYIAVKDLVQIAARLGETVSVEEINEMIQRADKDKDGVVSEEEFYAIMTRKV